MGYTVGSLFAGIGGICLGFKQSGCDVYWANEYNSKACETYALNFPKHKLYCKDVHDIKNPSDLDNVDIITSGFPCQAFSVAGYRKGFKDPRGNLFFETARFIDEIKPKAFLLETVNSINTLESSCLGLYLEILSVIDLEEDNGVDVCSSAMLVTCAISIPIPC